jgi:hypothetical protein
MQIKKKFIFYLLQVKEKHEDKIINWIFYIVPK